MSMGFLNGAENLSFREILRNAQVDNVCLTFSYAKRALRTNWDKALSNFSNVMITPGYISLDEVDLYIEFINKYENLLTFAVSYPGAFHKINDNVNVPVIPLLEENINEAPSVAVTSKDISYPFRIHLLCREGKIIHCLGTYSPSCTTFNTGAWLSSRNGYVYQYHHRKLMVYNFRNNSVRTSIARQLIAEGYNINLQAILKNDWKEVAFLNAIAWGKYLKVLETL